MEDDETFLLLQTSRASSLYKEAHRVACETADENVSRAQDEILDRIEKNKSSGHACFHCSHGFHWWSLLYSCFGITALTGLGKRSAKRVANEIRAAGFKVHVSSCGEFLTVSWS